jgi:hypothetical protein
MGLGLEMDRNLHALVDVGLNKVWDRFFNFSDAQPPGKNIYIPFSTASKVI